MDVEVKGVGFFLGLWDGGTSCESACLSVSWCYYKACEAICLLRARLHCCSGAVDAHATALMIC